MKKLILAVFFCLSVFAEDLVFEIYPVRFADPQEAADVIQMMLSVTNRFEIYVLDRKLAVKGTDEQHCEVRHMLEELDQPPKNIQINVQFNTSGNTSEFEAGVRQQGPIVIRNGNVSGSFGGRLSNRSTTTSESTTKMLVAMDGKTASLRVGESVPHLDWLVTYANRYGYVIETQVEWVDTGAFLAVEPSIVGPGLIRVRVIPEISGRVGKGPKQRIRFTHLATEVIVGDGQTVRIGGFNQDEEFDARFLVGGSSSSNVSVTDITLTPRILP